MHTHIIYVIHTPTFIWFQNIHYIDAAAIFGCLVILI